MTQNKSVLRKGRVWQGIGISAVLATLFLLLLTFSIALAAPQDGVVLENFTADNRLLIDEGILESAVATGYTTVRSEQILGVERDILFLSNGLLLEWDGDEGDPTSLDHTGLGGYDLTAGGFMDSFALGVTALNQPVQATLTVYSDESNASNYSLTLNSAGQVLVPLSAFETALGAGANFAEAGSIELIIQGNTAGLVLDSLEMQSSLTAERQVVLVADQNDNGVVDPNDVVEHTITVHNDGSTASAALYIVENVLGRVYSLVNGSVSAGPGQVLSGNSAGQQVVNVALDPISAGQSAEVSFRVTMLGGPAIPVTVVVQDGDTPPGSDGDTVSTLNSPFTNGDGDVGFSGSLTTASGTDNFIWFDTGITWRNSDGLPAVLTGAESTMGTSDSGGFIYSPSTDGDDSVWTHNGALLVDSTQAPDFPPGTTNTFNSRPTMTAGGEAYWVSGFNESGGTSTEGRMLYTSPNAMTSTIAVVIRSDDVISGFVVDRPSGIDFNYMASDNDSHLVAGLLMDTGSTTDDDFIYVDGALVARETGPTGDGDNWDNFDGVSINNSGGYIFSGDTDGATTTDEFIVYNGSAVVREGDTIGGIALTSSASVNALSNNNIGGGVFIWAISGGTEILFSSCDMSDVANNAVALLATDDMVDVDGNGTADAAVTDFNASNVIGPGLWLAEDGLVYVEVDLDYGAGELEAVIGLETGCVTGGGPVIEVAPPGMVSIQAADTQANQTLTISNTGDADLTWTIDEQPAAAGEAADNGQLLFLETDWGQVELEFGGGCVLPLGAGDIPWISANPTGGTTAAGSADDVTVTFDSTGISLGVLRADLCVNNNSITPTVQVPVVLEVPPAPSLALTKTVGLDPNTCAATDTINIPAGQGGTAVTYCYTVQNTGNITLSVQNLVDDQLGVLLGPDAAFDVPPGASDFLTVTAIITQTTVNSATWSAASAAGLHLDPAGDTLGAGAIQHDVIEFGAETAGGILTLQMVFSGTISPPGSGNPDELAGFIDMDRDNSALTGVPAFSAPYCAMLPTMGMEYLVFLNSYNPGAGTMELLFIDEISMTGAIVGVVDVTFTANSFTIEVPLSLLESYGPEEGIVDAAAVVGTLAEPTDCAPDSTVLTSRLEVSGSDDATVNQNAPTDVALSGIEGTAPAAWLPVWLLLLALAAMIVPAVLLRYSAKRTS